MCLIENSSLSNLYHAGAEGDHVFLWFLLRDPKIWKSRAVFFQQSWFESSLQFEPQLPSSIHPVENLAKLNLEVFLVELGSKFSRRLRKKWDCCLWGEGVSFCNAKNLPKKIGIEVTQVFFATLEGFLSQKKHHKITYWRGFVWQKILDFQIDQK